MHLLSTKTRIVLITVIALFGIIFLIKFFPKMQRNYVKYSEVLNKINEATKSSITIPPIVDKFEKNINCTKYINAFETILKNSFINCSQSYTYLAYINVFCNETTIDESKLMEYYISCGLNFSNRIMMNFVANKIIIAASVLYNNSSESIKNIICKNFTNSEIEYGILTDDNNYLIKSSTFIICYTCNFEDCLTKICNITKNIYYNRLSDFTDIGKLRIERILEACKNI